jgi:hypothetical protein
MELGEVAMRDVRSYRALGSLCRQRAVFDPDNSWKWLSEAERWEHLADAEIDAHYQECNSAGTTARDRNLPVERWRLAS